MKYTLLKKIMRKKIQGPVARKRINLIQDQPKLCFMFSTFCQKLLLLIVVFQN